VRKAGIAAHHGTAKRVGTWKPHLGRSQYRPWSSRRIRGADEITEAIVADIEPQPLCRRKFRAQAQAAEAWMMGFGVRGVVTLLAVTRQDKWSRRLCSRRRRHRSELRPTLEDCLPQPYVQWHMGWATWRGGAIAEACALAAIGPPDGGPGRIRVGWSICSPTLRRRAAEFELALRLNRISRCPRVVRLTRAIAAMGRRKPRPRRRALRMSPRDQFSASYYGHRLLASSVGRQLRRGERLRARVSASAPILAPTAC